MPILVTMDHERAKLIEQVQRDLRKQLVSLTQTTLEQVLDAYDKRHG